jgi:ankyrin repeat protein
MLLSIQHLLQMGIEEMYQYQFEMLLPLRGHSIWKEILEDLDWWEEPHPDLINDIRTHLDSKMPPATHRLLLQASQDLACVLPTRRQSDAISTYETRSHRPFAYILQLSGLRKGMRLNSEEVEALCQNRKAFLGGWSEVFHRHRLHETKAYHRLEGLGLDIRCNQFLTPRDALRIPSILEDVRNDGRRDIFDRSIAHMEHDAGFRKLWPEDALDQEDWIGRNSLHLACLRKDSVLLEQSMAKGQQTLVARDSLLRPLDVAAMHGYLEPLRALEEYDEDMFQNAVSEHSGYMYKWGLTIMHLAAAAGQVNIVKYLLNHLPSPGLVHTEDEDRSIPCHYAAEAGHMEMLNLLLAEDYSIRHALDREGNSLSWYAAKGDHTKILDRLEALEEELPPPSSSSQPTSPTDPLTSTSPADSSTPLAPVVATESLAQSQLTDLPVTTSNLNRILDPWTWPLSTGVLSSVYDGK